MNDDVVRPKLATGIRSHLEGGCAAGSSSPFTLALSSLLFAAITVVIAQRLTLLIDTMNEGCGEDADFAIPITADLSWSWTASCLS
jgi:hypothetical protein